MLFPLNYNGNRDIYFINNSAVISTHDLVTADLNIGYSKILKIKRNGSRFLLIEYCVKISVSSDMRLIYYTV